MWPVTYFWGVSRPLGGSVVFLGLLLSLRYNQRNSQGPHSWGLDGSHFGQGLKKVAPWTLLFVAGILVWGRILGTGRLHPHLVLETTILVVWALVQQFALQTVIFREARNHLSEGKAVLSAAAVFALLPVPNPLLAVLTFTGAWIWCRIYARHPNLFPLALSHGLCSLAILSCLPRSLTAGMRVGFSYFLR